MIVQTPYGPCSVEPCRGCGGDWHLGIDERDPAATEDLRRHLGVCADCRGIDPTQDTFSIHFMSDGQVHDVSAARRAKRRAARSSRQRNRRR